MRRWPPAIALGACLLAAGAAACAQDAGAAAAMGGGTAALKGGDAAAAMGGDAAAASEGGAPGWRERLNVSGSLRGAAWSSTRDLDDRRDIGSAAAWLRAAPKLGERATLAVEGWSRNDRGRARARLREAYVDVRTGSIDLRLGQQIIAWGRADELNPTDNLSPRDFTLLTPENGDQRLGTVGARMAVHAGDTVLTAAWLPRFRSNVFPVPVTPGARIRRDVPERDGGALKLERTGTPVEGSVSVYDGLDPNPDLELLGAGPGGIDLVLRNHPIRVLGADVATVAGRWGLRAEAAYTWTRHDALQRPLVKKPFFYGVAGVDRTFDNGLYLNVQVYLRRVSGFTDPGAIPDALLQAVAVQSALTANQRHREEHGLSLRVSNRWLNDTLEAELVSVVSATRGDQVWQGRVRYAINDQLKLTLGLDRFRGGDDTYYGRLRRNSASYAEVKVAF